MNVSKLLIKELIDSSLAHGRMLDDDYVPLQQFFVVLEHVLRHGLKRKFLCYLLRLLLLDSLFFPFVSSSSLSFDNDNNNNNHHNNNNLHSPSFCVGAQGGYKAYGGEGG